MNLLKVYNSKLKSTLNNMDHIVIVILSTFAAHLAALIFFLTLKIPIMVIINIFSLIIYSISLVPKIRNDYGLLLKIFLALDNIKSFAKPIYTFFSISSMLIIQAFHKKVTIFL